MECTPAIYISLFNSILEFFISSSLKQVSRKLSVYVKFSMVNLYVEPAIFFSISFTVVVVSRKDLTSRPFEIT